MEYAEIREQICDVCHKMWQLGWVAANDGNVSVKLPDGRFLATPTGISKSFITPEKLVVIDGTGAVVNSLPGYTCAATASGKMSAQSSTPIRRPPQDMPSPARALTNIR